MGSLPGLVRAEVTLWWFQILMVMVGRPDPGRPALATRCPEMKLRWPTFRAALSDVTGNLHGLYGSTSLSEDVELVGSPSVDKLKGFLLK